MAYGDWPLTHLVAIDRMTVARIRGEFPGEMPGVELWTKQSSLELPPGWRHRPAPGIDSGSLAVAVALEYPDPVIIIGADGVMGGATASAYDYPWHSRVKKPHIHQRHRSALVNLHKQHPGRIRVVWPLPDPDLETIPLEQAKLLLG